MIYFPCDSNIEKYRKDKNKKHGARCCWLLILRLHIKYNISHIVMFLWVWVACKFAQLHAGVWVVLLQIFTPQLGFCLLSYSSRFDHAAMQLLLLTAGTIHLLTARAKPVLTCLTRFL
jgi:hypothetical protein